MRPRKLRASSLLGDIAIAALLAFSGNCHSETLRPIVDDFGDAEKNSFGIPRHFMDDSTAGGNTSTRHSVSEGILTVSGEILPARGQPGWSSAVLLLDSQGRPRDASVYEGVRLVVRVNKGNISVSANSTEVTNFDYHAAPVIATSDGGFHEVKIPFTSMKRAWSEQTPLNTSAISSLSIVAFDLQKGSFDFEVEEVGFY